jgi:hypothetical protein
VADREAGVVGGRLSLGTGRAGAERRHTGHRVQVHQPAEVADVDHDAAAHRDGAPDDARPAGVRRHRYTGAVGPAQDLRDLVDGPRADDRVRLHRLLARPLRDDGARPAVAGVRGSLEAVGVHAVRAEHCGELGDHVDAHAGDVTQR